MYLMPDKKWLEGEVKVDDSYQFCKYLYILKNKKSNMYGSHLKVSGQLHTQLNNPELTVQELFCIPNIIGDIKQNIQQFLLYCKKKRSFTTQMLGLCFDSTYEELDKAENKNVVHIMCDVLSSDEDLLNRFLFVEEKNEEKEGEVEESIEEEVTESIETEAERLFNDDEPEMEASWKKEPFVFGKDQIVKMTLNILNNPNKNETCLGYINKIYSGIIRREALPFLEFLSSNKQYIDLMIKGVTHFAVANLLMLILSSQDKTAQYKHEQFKKQIFNSILEECFENIGNQVYFEGLLSVVEEVLNTTKQSYYQYFQDFKRCANVLVEESTLKKFYDILCQRKGVQFVNALSYLELVMRRINAEQDQNDYYKTDNQQPSMKFQHQFLLREMSSLTKIGERVITSKYSSVTKICYFSFMTQLLKNSHSQQITVSKSHLFEEFMEYLVKQKGSGMIKNNLYQLVVLIMKKMNEQDLESSLKWLYQNENQTISRELRSLNPYQDHAKNNSNQTSCFLWKILCLFKQKLSNFAQFLQQDENNKIQMVFVKYQIKLAKEEEVQQKNKNIDEFPLQLPIKLGNKKKAGEQTTVGKNSISIPALVLPNRNNDGNVRVEEEEVKKIDVEKMSREQLIRDLKETKFELPEKYKKKQNLPPQELSEKKSVIAEKSEKKVKAFPYEGIQFFIKHLILF